MNFYLFFATNVKQLVFEDAIAVPYPTQFYGSHLTFYRIKWIVNSDFLYGGLYLICSQASPLSFFRLTGFIKPHLFNESYKFTMHLYKGSYYLYLGRSGKRSERPDLRVRKSNAILQLVPLAALAKAYAWLTAFCLYTVAYYIASFHYIVMKLLSEGCLKFKLDWNQ